MKGGGLSADELEAVLRAAGNVMDLEITAEKNVTQTFKDKTLKVALRPELESINQYTGKLSQRLSRSLGTGFSSGTGKSQRIDEILKNVDVFNLRGSPSITEIVDNELDAVFFEGKKKKPNKYVRSKVRVKRRIPARNQQNIALKRRVKARLATLKTKVEAAKRKKRFVIPTITLKAIINESLAEYIKLRMDKPSDPAIRLRNQTGRFAESARLLTLNRTEAGALIGTYDFMRNPYGTFLPGGRLHTQQRNPSIYIEGAIRDIAIQVLKKQFNGISLELS